MHPMVLLGEEAQVEACFGHLEIALILMQDRCTVYAEPNLCLEVILDANDRTPR